MQYPFPPFIDSTMLAAFRSCPRKCYLSYIEHWKPKGESVHLVAGKAFAKGIEEARTSFYIKEKSAQESIEDGLAALLISYGNFECPPESAKSASRMAGALEFYFECYPLGMDKATPILNRNTGETAGIEFSFAEPLSLNRPDTSDPLLYVGRADLVADFAHGIYIFDEKTTSQLGPSWARQWELRSQFTGYCWAARKVGIEASGVIVRGISILKTKYGNMDVLTYRSDWEVERWEEQVYKDILRMMRCHSEDYWDYSLDHACIEYGGCPFAQVCKSPTPELWLETYFTRRVWDPLAREEYSIEEFHKRWGGGDE